MRNKKQTATAEGKHRRERGAVLVEMAFMLPVLVLLIFGSLEFGLIFKERLTIASAASSAARTGATMGTRAAADFRILEALEAGLYGQVDAGVLISVDIFKADPVTGAKDLSAYNRYQYVGGGGCKWTPCPDPDNFVAYGAPSLWGDPSNRDTSLDSGGAGLDVLGLEITYQHTAVTNILPALNRNFTERALVRLEPDVFTATP